MAVMSFFVLCLVLLWLVGNQWCATDSYSWMGLMPMQVWSEHCLWLCTCVCTEMLMHTSVQHTMFNRRHAALFSKADFASAVHTEAGLKT